MMRKAEVVVIGAGPAGIAAATAAAQHGRSTIVLDDNPAAGGQIWRGVDTAQGKGDAAKRKALAALQSSGAEILLGRRVVDAPRPGILRVVVDTEGGATPESIAWDRLILATGARELFLPFPGWTLPGVFGAGGLQALLKGGFSVEGKRVVIAGTGPLLLAVGAHLRQYGAKVVSIAEQAPLGQLLPFALSLWSSPGKLVEGASYRAVLGRIPYRTGCWPVSVEGDTSVRAVRLTDGRRTWSEPCDLLACGFHLVPNTELAALLGCRFRGDFVEVDRQQQTSVANVFCVGEPTSIGGLDAALVQGEIAGLVAADEAAKASALFARRNTQLAFARRLKSAFRLRSELRSLAAPGTIVCRCEDVRYAQLQGRSSWTEAKLATRCGMGSCQGRICGPAVQMLFHWRPSSVRPPIFPVPISVFDEDDSISYLTTQSIPQETL
jgi:NADPH-dependent 2,4-dienoyl-CoA reductase/sulfur reductase-like enzyme